MNLSEQPQIYRLQVASALPVRAEAVLSQLPALGVTYHGTLQIFDLYFFEGDLSEAMLERIARNLICDPVTDRFTLRKLADRVFVSTPSNESGILEVALRPGVTDTTAAELLRAAHQIGATSLRAVATGTRYQFNSSLPAAELQQIARALLVNDTIQRYTFGEITPEFIHDIPAPTQPELFDLRPMDDAALLALSAARRLALDLNEMRAIQAYFAEQNRPATDAELETIAQTWSEHCVHKTFKALITLTPYPSEKGQRAGDERLPLPPGEGRGERSETINSLIKTYLQAATNAINAPWVRSAFVDNAGVIAFDERYDLSFKVETHNHPSAIEPFGGANTGVGGVVRDILGVSHRPIANTDVLCFGPAELLHTELPPGVLHPRRIRAGVVAGVQDYGNKLGLPTVNGAVWYHPGYTANPLVFCGCVGLGPRDCHPRHPQPNDRIIVLGGRTGRDGLRGATFSSLTMDAQTGEVAGSSVQIGDPITEKGLIEVIERARDARLYHAITDCGAGGLSSAVGEMAAELGGQVDLQRVPLKYAGLAAWEIWLSEAQERMVLAVPAHNLPALQTLCNTYRVELSDIGEFLPTGRLQVFYGETPIVDLQNGFLHTCPRRELTAHLPTAAEPLPNPAAPTPIADPAVLHSTLLRLLAHPNIASKEDIIRLYDHQVRGMTILPPLTGVHANAPSDAAVLKPQETEGWRGFVLANGINPLLTEPDPYRMAFSAVDEAIRNAVAVGANPAQLALLDNFCWGDPSRPETLGTLVEAARGCHDAALHYNTPFISGKDSLNNEYLGSDGKRHAIPGTLLISAIAIHPDVRHTVSMDAKTPGNHIYLLGDWIAALAGSHAAWILTPETLPAPEELLRTPPQISVNAPKVYHALHQAIQHGLIRACHDLSEGGLAVAAAEMCLGGNLGFSLDVSALHANPFVALYAETNGCLLLEVTPQNASALKEHLHGLPLRLLGEVTAEPMLTIRHNTQQIQWAVESFNRC